MVHLSELEAALEVVEGCRNGDREAFRALYEIYKDRVYSIAFYFLHGDAAAAGDVTQQVFLKVIAKITHFRGDAGFSTWLYRLVVNACMDEARSKRLRPILYDKAELETVAAPDSQEAGYARQQTSRSVRAAITELPAKFRIAILLRYFDDLSYEEMAKALRCSMGTVASRLSRGHRMLAERLKGIAE